MNSIGKAEGNKALGRPKIRWEGTFNTVKGN
jgi:hypothetical protein